MNLCDIIELPGLNLERGKPEDPLELIFQEIAKEDMDDDDES